MMRRWLNQARLRYTPSALIVDAPVRTAPLEFPNGQYGLREK
jgi:hypothetical protein